ncbi:copper amine oxidase N-terminal domain-containing protein [Rubeoparvulum massiliense]|uniref:copper amine oxidase N-terminal domain-containing protein n=1 Tax=Rubeoparvulum massiliense TaxID=1631346 RepID=UPI00065E79F6|nr:copper amine oxidase N-terminal domain-containing protein [Rubeoparvulum massiliense]
MKRFIIGFLSGALIFGSLTAFAVSGKMIEVFYTVKDIKINQISKMPKEEQLKPFIHKGTTFVPLRYISENLGYPVAWDGKTNTVLIGETGEETAVYPGNGIESMNFQKGSWHDYTYKYNSSRTVADNIGNQYSNYLTFSVSSGSKEENWCELEFPLMGEYH